MALLAEMGRRRSSKEQEAEAQKLEIIKKYGETLGEKYIKYTHGRTITFKEQEKQRKAFADAVVTALESGNHEERVQGIEALLNSFEAMIAPVARRAARVDSRTAVFS